MSILTSLTALSCRATFHIWNTENYVAALQPDATIIIIIRRRKRNWARRAYVITNITALQKCSVKVLKKSNEWSAQWKKKKIIIKRCKVAITCCHYCTSSTTDETMQHSNFSPLPSIHKLRNAQHQRQESSSACCFSHVSVLAGVSPVVLYGHCFQAVEKWIVVQWSHFFGVFLGQLNMGVHVATAHRVIDVGDIISRRLVLAMQQFQERPP